MKTLSYTTIDKSTWGDGPWQTEPDKMQFEDPTTGLPCLLVRNRATGSWCGYAGVRSDHPAYGKHYDNSLLSDINVHGGLTFADKCRPSATEDTGICHVVEPGENDDIWWLGFDCAHAGDESPALNAVMGGFRSDSYSSRYRDERFVQKQATKLAAQLADLM